MAIHICSVVSYVTVSRISFRNKQRRAVVNRVKATALVERIITDARHAIRYRDAREVTATFERKTTDARHAIRNRDIREARASVERIITDARHTIWNRDARETTATAECIIANTRHAIPDIHRFDVTSVAVPRHRGRRSIILHHPRSANGQ